MGPTSDLTNILFCCFATLPGSFCMFLRVKNQKDLCLKQKANLNGQCCISVAGKNPNNLMDAYCYKHNTGIVHNSRRLNDGEQDMGKLWKLWIKNILRLKLLIQLSKIHLPLCPLGMVQVLLWSVTRGFVGGSDEMGNKGVWEAREHPLGMLGYLRRWRGTKIKKNSDMSNNNSKHLSPVILL